MITWGWCSVSAPLIAMLDQLPAGQRRVCETLSDRHCYRYIDVATALQISAGTVRRHLARVRSNHPAVYRKLMAQRRRQLEERHVRALAREEHRRGYRFLGFEVRRAGHQVSVDLHGFVAAIAYYKLDPAEIDQSLAKASFQER